LKALGIDLNPFMANTMNLSTSTMHISQQQLAELGTLAKAKPLEPGLMGELAREIEDPDLRIMPPNNLSVDSLRKLLNSTSSPAKGGNAAQAIRSYLKDHNFKTVGDLFPGKVVF